MSLHHGERHRWVKEISEINKRINATQAGPAPAAQPATQAAAPAPPRQPPPPPGVSRMGPGVAMRNDPEAVRKALAEAEARRSAKG